MPPPTLKIAASGLRGVVGESLTPQLVTSFAAAFGNYCGAGPVLVGADQGLSAQMLKQAAFAGLMSVGSPPVDLGVVPLPALMLYVRATGARGAICIGSRRGGRQVPLLRPVSRETSPAGSSGEWSAIRFIGADGSVLRTNQAAELTDLFHQGVYSRVQAQGIPQIRIDGEAVARHRAAVLAAVDVGAIAARRFRVALEHGNGPAAPATLALLQALGCEVIASGGDLVRAVGDGRAALGLVQDADGDRLALVDERGEALPEDATVALAVEHWLRRSPGPVVVNVSTSHMVDAAAARQGGTVVRTVVGETQVLDKMREVGAQIGGEGDGGLLLQPVNPCRDSLVAIVLVLEALASTTAVLSERCAYLRAYVPLRETLLCPSREVGPALRWLRHVYRGSQLDRSDGLKVSWDDRWLHVRPSHSDAILRLTVEAPTRPEAQTLLNELLEHLSPEG
jgi:phosphomannomutase